MAEQGLDVWGVDRSASMLAKAQQQTGRAKFRQADAAHLSFQDRFFDIVLAASLIHVVDSPRAVLIEMQRVCRKGGTVSVLVPAQSFSSADAKRYVAAEHLSGFSAAAFTGWHHLARMMDVEVLRGLFTKCGMENISTEELLGGMVVAISGQGGAN